MALAVGTRQGHFEMQAVIGQGGMGEVYRASDTQLKCDTAQTRIAEPASVAMRRFLLIVMSELENHGDSQSGKSSVIVNTDPFESESCSS